MSSALIPSSIAAADLSSVVQDVLQTTPFIDIHTHLFAPSMGELGLWGIDELLTYHYLEAELFRFAAIEPAEYFKLSKPQKADLVWQTLFVENSPVSEAARGVIAVLSALGLDTHAATLEPLRGWFRERKLADYIPQVFRLAGISSVVMTNDPLDPAEAPLWLRGLEPDPMFHAALRLDRILNDWPAHHEQVASGRELTPKTLAEVQRFLVEWGRRMKALYVAVSLPDSFRFPAEDERHKLLTGAVLPACSELGVPISLMIGVRRQVNPAIRLAGDGVAKADATAVEALCREYPDQRFLVSILSRENQHELCVLARKFRNLMPFGCWWFLNNPSIVEEMTRERLEMLGTSFIPQHSDARILEQIIYKWRNTRRTIGPILSNAYRLLTEDGRPVTREDIERDVTRLFRTNFTSF